MTHARVVDLRRTQPTQFYLRSPNVPLDTTGGEAAPSRLDRSRAAGQDFIKSRPRFGVRRRGTRSVVDRHNIVSGQDLADAATKMAKRHNDALGAVAEKRAETQQATDAKNQSKLFNRMDYFGWALVAGEGFEPSTFGL